MNTAAYLIVIVLVATALYFGARSLVRAYLRYRGTRMVTCPETGKPTAVEVNALRATLTSAVGVPDIQLQSCWRWPEKKQCGQECLADLDVAPGECLVSGVLMRWYRGKNCAYCDKPFQEIQWTDHRPALRTPEGKLIRWPEVPIENLTAVLETHEPVCWDCYIVQSFRVEHPDLVVLRPWRKGSTGEAGGLPASRHH